MILSIKRCNGFKLKMEECRVKIEVFRGFKVKSLGKVKVLSENNNEKIETEFIVVEVGTVYIVGFKNTRQIGCINNVSIVKKLLSQNYKKKKFIEIKKDIFNGGRFFPNKVTVNLYKEVCLKFVQLEEYPISILKKN